MGSVSTRRLALFSTLSAAAAAALAFFLDPAGGKRRRHRARDQAWSLTRHAARRSRRLVRHAFSDTVGFERRFVHRFERGEADLDDATLAHKVESILFRDPAVPKGEININAEKGVVYLRGQIDDPDVIETLEERVRKVKGVRGVENRLHTPEAAS